MFAFQNNRRTQPRAPVQLDATVGWNGRELDTRLLLISEGGCFVEIAPAPPQKTLLRLTFDIPGKGPHSVEAEVRYASALGDFRGSKDVTGVGCQFTHVSATTRQAIRDLIAQVKRSYAQIQQALSINSTGPQLNALLEKARLPSLKEPRALQDAVQWGLKQMGI